VVAQHAVVTASIVELAAAAVALLQSIELGSIYRWKIDILEIDNL
jgi:hypothetical protein